jgi:hypothetical protein
MLLSPTKAEPIKHHYIFPGSILPLSHNSNISSEVKPLNSICTEAMFIRQACHVRMFAGDDANTNSKRHSSAFQ